jgi:hypothetical protein
VETQPRTGEDALRAIAKGWLKKIELSLKHKRPFTEDGKEAMCFFDGPHNWFWRDTYARHESGYNRTIAPPAFRMQCNRVFEAVKLFGSVIYHRNPVRSVTPAKYPFVSPEVVGVMDEQSMMLYQQAAQETMQKTEIRRMVGLLMEKYLNYTPQEMDLKTHSRRVVDEAIIKGMGLWWTEIVTLPGTDFSVVGSFADSVDNFTMDPDATEIEDITWCARRCVHPIDVVARQYGLDREQLKGHLEGARPLDAAADDQIFLDDSHSHSGRRVGKSNELVTYWKVWSKTGLGDRLKDAPKEMMGTFDSLGENCYIVVCEGVDFPLNMPPSLLEQEVEEESGVPQDLFLSVQWPIPFWTEPNGWPFVPLDFHRKPGYIWPISHIKPGIGELRFINFALSFIAQRVAISCETLVGVSKAADQDIKDQILSGSEKGFKVVEISETLGRSVNDLISVFTLPEVSPELWKIMERVTEMFDKRVGLTELAYAMTSSQIRSATEATVKAEQLSVRPDDMANRLEDAMSLLARREALAARWLLQPQDIEPILGPLGAAAWVQHITQMSPSEVAREFEYRIEAGSARKPNKATRVEQMQAALQTLGPILQGLVPMGVVDPLNALISDWADSLDIDAKPYLIPPPPPPQPPPGALPGPEQGGPPTEGPEGPMPPEGPPGPPPEAGPPPQIPPEMMPA